jgi:uncharacterized protein YndB with AHSA1/START domain
METTQKTAITVECTVNAGIDKVWACWNEPEHIMNWCSASEDWHVPAAESDLRVGGTFSTTMAAKDGSFSFDFAGVYTQVVKNELIEYTLNDDRKVKIVFSGRDNEVRITETFEAEDTNPLEMQQGGWQAILDNFKKYAEQV